MNFVCSRFPRPHSAPSNNAFSSPGPHPHHITYPAPPPPSSQLPLPQQQPYPANHAITASYNTSGSSSSSSNSSHSHSLQCKPPDAHDRNFNMLPVASRHGGYSAPMVPVGEDHSVNVKQEPHDKGYENGQCCGECAFHSTWRVCVCVPPSPPIPLLRLLSSIR